MNFNNDLNKSFSLCKNRLSKQQEEFFRIKFCEVIKAGFKAFNTNYVKITGQFITKRDVYCMLATCIYNQQIVQLCKEEAKNNKSFQDFLKHQGLFLKGIRQGNNDLAGIISKNVEYFNSFEKQIMTFFQEFSQQKMKQKLLTAINMRKREQAEIQIYELKVVDLMQQRAEKKKFIKHKGVINNIILIVQNKDEIIVGFYYVKQKEYNQSTIQSFIQQGDQYEQNTQMKKQDEKQQQRNEINQEIVENWEQKKEKTKSIENKQQTEQIQQPQKLSQQIEKKSQSINKIQQSTLSKKQKEKLKKEQKKEQKRLQKQQAERLERQRRQKQQIERPKQRVITKQNNPNNFPMDQPNQRPRQLITSSMRENWFIFVVIATIFAAIFLEYMPQLGNLFGEGFEFVGPIMPYF